MTEDPKRLIELFPCTNDIRDCEIMRAAMALKDSAPQNERSQAILEELKEAACKHCIAIYLSGTVNM